jgi:hypothetical protein
MARPLFPDPNNGAAFVPESETSLTGSGEWPEPVFVNLLGAQGIDSQPAGRYDNLICRTGPPGYIGWRIDSLDSIPGLLKCLQIRAQLSPCW